MQRRARAPRRTPYRISPRVRRPCVAAAPCCTPYRSLLVSVSDAPARKIVWRHLDANAVADEYAYSVLAHLAGNLCQHDVVAVVYADFEKGVRLFVYDDAHGGERLFF